MGILSKFGLGKKKDIPKELEGLNLPPKGMDFGIGKETPEMSNVRAKMDLVMTQLESMTIKYQNLIEKIDRIERMVQEIYTIAKKS